MARHLAPRGTPQIIDKLRPELNAVLAMPEVKERLTSGRGRALHHHTPRSLPP